MATANALADYHRMRDFAQTPEPRDAASTSTGGLSFVIQKHAARNLHYDFRLELDGTLKSWAVPKGPSLDPSVKRMALQVEDHPMSYADFEGTIPPKHYGAGTVIVWDRGGWSPVGDARSGLRDGHLKFDLAGEKLCGRWALVRMKPRRGERQPTWLLMKERDDAARAADEFDVLTAEPGSVLAAKKPSRKAAARAEKCTEPAALPQMLAPQIKLKTLQRQEFVIGGYTDPKGRRSGIGALLLGAHDATGALRYAGNVDTGFDERMLADLKQRLTKLDTARSPFTDPPAKVGARSDSTPHWVEPKLIAEVSFAQWTTRGRIRHAVFHGLRDDKPAAQIAREKPQPIAAAKAPRATGASPRVTHAERVIDAASGVTKGELFEHYARVADLMLPHLKVRPVALVRAPSGVAGAQFFQKHADENALPGITLLDPALDPGHEALLVVAAAKGLLSAAQMNVIELHTWNMTTRTLPKPDRMVFDLDPGEGVAWPAVREAAGLLHAFLGELGLASLLKTSGGKGLHVVVPLAPRHTWQAVRQFSQAIVVHMARVVPQRFVAKSGPRNRVGKIYIDYLRNGWGATTASAWSARARAGLGVSVPVDWSELPQVGGGAHWTVRNIDARLAVGNAPWGAMGASRQTLTKAMKALDFKPTETRE
ncbi:MAG: DNA ligase D [Rhizobiales bacterium]|nr:DNA ligase D [Rhizobacter sp.]